VLGYKEKARIIDLKTRPEECHWTHKGKVPQFIAIKFADGSEALCSPNQLRKR
jgi:hypothetical protein